MDQNEKGLLRLCDVAQLARVSERAIWPSEPCHRRRNSVGRERRHLLRGR
jgi:hypothetical protein